MKVIVFLALGFEKVETLTVVDYLRRVKPIQAEMVSIADGLAVLGSHQIAVKADKHIDDLGDLDIYAAVIIPGGMPGAANLRDDGQKHLNWIWRNEGSVLKQLSFVILMVKVIPMK